MLVIRPEQVQVFQGAALRSFEDEMVAHLAEFSPPLFKTIKEDQLRKAIRFGIARASDYGITFRGPVRLYLELMLLFGSHFDTDPQYPWAAEVLADQDSGPQMTRAEKLYERTRDYREKVAGPEDAYAQKALRGISVWARQPLWFSSDGFVPAMLQELADAYPQKAAYVGEDRLKLLIREGIDGARSHEFTTVRGVALSVVLMFAFGHGCFDDLLYPWIARTIEDDAITDSAARAKRLETKALTWLDHVLASSEQAGATRT